MMERKKLTYLKLSLSLKLSSLLNDANLNEINSWSSLDNHNMNNKWKEARGNNQ
jgi:hypothetical protein